MGSSLRLKDLEEIDGLKRAIYDLQFINDCIEFDDYYEYYDEEEETRILSYAEREELERAKRQKEEEYSSDVSSKIDEELNKSLSFDYEYENDDEDDE